MIIFGLAGSGDLIYEYLRRQEDYDVVCFTVDRSYIGGVTTYRDLPVVVFEELHKHYPPDGHGVVVALQNDKLFENRKRVFYECKSKGYTLPNIIHKHSIIEESSVMGEGNIIWGNAYVDDCCRIGDCNIIASGVQITHHTTIGDFNFLSASGTFGGNLCIGSNNFFGLNSTVRHGIGIGNYCLIGASAYVSFSLKDYSVVVPEKSKLVKGLSSKDLPWF